MRVALVIHEYPPVGGGAATAAHQTARALAKLGHAVLVITAGVPGQPRSGRDGPVEIQRLPSLRLRTLAPSAVELVSFCASAELHLRRRLRAFEADGVIAYFAVPAGFFAVRAARALGVPIVVSLRGSDVPGFSNGRLEGPLGRLARPVVRYTLNRADRVAPNSEILRRLVVAFAPEVEAKTRIVRNGIESELVARTPATSNASELRLIQVGQLIERKRIDVTLAALAQLANAGVAARLTVIGDGPLRSELVEQCGALGLTDRVVFEGHLPRSEIVERLRKHDAFVMTSMAEGMSNALVEAIAAGLPVVTSDNGSHDIVQQARCGLVVPRDNPDELCVALTKLAKNQTLRRSMAEAGLSFARGASWEHCAQGFVDLFNK